MRQLATIQRIEEIQPIEGADAIEKARVKGWWVVIRKGDFKVGDTCVYYEIDSFLPLRPEYAFLLKGSKPKKMLVDGKEQEGIRLRTIRLRGQISQGLVLAVPEALKSVQIGQDVSAELGITKYEPPIPANLAGVVKGAFPAFIPKTDEERLQNCMEILEQQKGSLVYITSKLDGTSATYFRHDGEFGVCSRNLELKESLGNTLWEMADKYKLKERFPEGFAIQGEIVGEGIQKNPLKIKGHRLFVFNVFDIKACRYLDFGEVVFFCQHEGLEMVPVLSPGVALDFTFEQLMAIAGKRSPLNPDVLQEGIVVRSVTERRVMIGGVESRFSFKVVSNEYLMEVEG